MLEVYKLRKQYTIILLNIAYTRLKKNVFMFSVGPVSDKHVVHFLF